MDGDSLPVSAFVDHVDGQFELGACRYEKRGVAVTVPAWDADQVHPVQPVRLRLPPRHHPSLRADRGRGRRRARGCQDRGRQGRQGQGHCQFTMAISPLDCMGCGVCVGVCPGRALTMVPRRASWPSRTFRLLRGQGRREEGYAGQHRQGQPVQAAAAGVLRLLRRLRRDQLCPLVTQLFGDRMYISNATGCSSIWGGPAATSPYCTDKDGHGPAWCNSLFEDNAEHGFGMYLGQKAIREEPDADKTR